MFHFIFFYPARQLYIHDLLSTTFSPQPSFHILLFTTFSITFSLQPTSTTFSPQHPQPPQHGLFHRPHVRNSLLHYAVKLLNISTVPCATRSSRLCCAFHPSCAIRSTNTPSAAMLSRFPGQATRCALSAREDCGAHHPSRRLHCITCAARRTTRQRICTSDLTPSAEAHGLSSNSYPTARHQRIKLPPSEFISTFPSTTCSCLLSGTPRFARL